jgi:hypothetical protein
MPTHHGAMVLDHSFFLHAFISAAKEAEIQKPNGRESGPAFWSGPFCHKHVTPLAVCSWYALPLSVSFAAQECLV